MNDAQLKEWGIFVISVILGLSPAAGGVPNCGDVDNFLYSKLLIIRAMVALIVGTIAYVGIVDVFEVPKKFKPTRRAKVFVTGLVTGMTIFQVAAMIMGSTCFEYSWLLPIPSK